MSIPVDLDALASTTAGYGWAYLLTVRDDQRAHIVAITPEWDDDGSMTMPVGAGTARNAEARPNVSLAYPPGEADGYSLIVDGDATVERGEAGAVVRFRPTGAVLHRPAPVGFVNTATGCSHDCAPVDG